MSAPVVKMMDPLVIRFSQGNIGEQFKDGTDIFDTYERICEGMEKRQVPMMHVVQRTSGQFVTLDNRRLAVYKMACRAGKCRAVKVQWVPLAEVKDELRRKSDSTVEGLSVRVRGTDKTIHADGSVTTERGLSDGQLQHRADMGGHWSEDQRSYIGRAISDFDAVVKRVIGTSASLMKAGSYMKGTDISGESDIDVMVFGTGPISETQWNGIVGGIKHLGYTIQSTNPRCIHVAGQCGCITIEFDVVASQRQGFPPNKMPTNPFKTNRLAANAVRNIKLDFKESGDSRCSGNDIEQAVLSEQGKLESVTLGKLIDAAKAALRSDMIKKLKRPLSAARENNASSGTTDWDTAPIGEGQFKKVYAGKFTVGERAGQAKVSKVFKDGKQAFEDSFFEHDVAVVEKTIGIVEEFNKVKKFSKLLQVCKPAIWHRTYTKQRLLVEPYIANFKKFNSNTGWVGSGEWAIALQSLSHFSYHFSGGQLVLCDLQGAAEDSALVLTDPAINSCKKEFGPADLGQQGIDNFFHHHVCSRWCDPSWRRPPKTVQRFTPTMGTSMILPS